MLKLSGKVIKGDGYGRKIGFPTANLNVEEKVNLKDGVYSGVAILEGVKYRAGIVIGPNGKVEAHLIGFSGDLYGKELELEVNEFIREYRNFENKEDLVSQILEDIKICSQE